MIVIFLFVLGAIVGSFLNVVSLRWPEPHEASAKWGISIFGGRSHCPTCHKTLKWWELVPIFSFLFLKAKCSQCGAKISWQYPIIEIWTGLIFATVPSVFLLVFCLYIIITIYDFKYKIIPDELVYISIILAFINAYSLLPTTYSTLDWLAGPILFTFFGLFWLLSKGRAMGFGDAKLGLSVGLLLGAAQGFSAIVLAFWIGALGSLIYIVLNKCTLPVGKASFLKNNKELTMKSEVPFAPFIVIGAWISLVFHLNILHVASL